MVTTIFPETFFVLGDEFDLADPFRTFPEVPFWDNDPDGAAMFLRKVFSLPGMRERTSSSANLSIRILVV